MDRMTLTTTLTLLVRASRRRQERRVSKYLEHAPSIDMEDVFSYWSAELQPITGGLPSLGKVAHRCLGKPATSAASERSFSRAGFLIQCRRNRLSPRTIDNILFLNNYLNNKLRN
ncbi:E3 SUMO-protein ligase ZBED1 [Frankliniella fusca]|uniref:E3 SUMO-protein ligase ZBED1 n=1 Tax=Frankliniella fusca TaxID=407009 RepID=A0AAE1L8E8_9NEOP|nr:E3 SUMO-protein ligase ZBED1 [Frankliniella fusca]